MISRKLEYLIWFVLVGLVTITAVFVIDTPWQRAFCVAVGMCIIHFLGEHEGRADTVQNAMREAAKETQPNKEQS